MQNQQLPQSAAMIQFSRFAEAISTLNMGAGVPCTMRRLSDKVFTPIEIENKRTQFQSELATEAAGAIQRLNDLIAEIEGLKLSKKAKQPLKNKAIAVHRRLDDSLPFVVSMCAEVMDDLEFKVKIEISAHAAHIVQEHGIQSIQTLKLHESKSDTALTQSRLNSFEVYHNIAPEVQAKSRDGDSAALAAISLALYCEMSRISEDETFAGWIIGNEYNLWDRLNEFPALAELSELCDGWVVWADEDCAVPRCQLVMLDDGLSYRCVNGDIAGPAWISLADWTIHLECKKQIKSIC